MRTHIVLGLLLALSGTTSRAAPFGEESWRQAQAPFRIYGNTYYVGSRGLSAILITSPQGAILVDGTLPENAPMVEANLRTLGVKIEEVKLILNSHPHADHAGAIAALARDSGATVAAVAAGAKALRAGGDDPDDPQHGDIPTFPRVARVQVVADGETLRVGPLAVTAHATPGHTPGSTSWTWTSCEANRCHSMVYADSLGLRAAVDYRYSDPAHPERLRGYEQTLRTVAALPCDILIAPHPEAVGLLQRTGQAAKPVGGKAMLVDPQACKAYAADARASMAEFLAGEAGKPAR